MSNIDFEKIVTSHRRRYPLMRPEDYFKLAYQNEYGPEHLITDKDEILSRLIREWKDAPETDKPPEDIGNGLCRFHLNGKEYSETAANLLAKLFCMTASSVKGTADWAEKNLAYLETLDVDDMHEKLAEYRAAGCPPIRHSEEFRKAYDPHYRLLRTEYAGYFPVLCRIAELSERASPVIISADGRCGSGKTCFAELISEIFPCNVFHTDDFYLPISERAENWREIPGGNIDFNRLLSEVITPLQENKDILYRPYICMKKDFGEPIAKEYKPLNIIEGSYSQNPILTQHYDLTIFLDCTEEKQSARLKKREGGHYRDFEEIWIPLEESHIKKYNVQNNADIVINTSDLF